MTGDERVITEIRRMAREEQSLVSTLDYIHRVAGMPHYNRGLTMRWLHPALGLGPRDFTQIIFACEIFGDGASVPLAEVERAYAKRVQELRARWDR